MVPKALGIKIFVNEMSSAILLNKLMMSFIAAKLLDHSTYPYISEM